MSIIEFTATRYHPNFAYHCNDFIIGGSLRCYGEYAQHEVNFLLELIRAFNLPSVVVYDIGANIGYHTTAFASAGAEVYSFEPCQVNYDLLKQNTQGMPTVHLFKKALSDYTGKTFVEVPDLDQLDNYGRVHIGAASGEEVDVTTIDELNLPSPNLIKIDVEGVELNVLRGALNVINNIQPVIYYEAQENQYLAEIYDLLVGRNYRLYWAVINNFNANNFKNYHQDVFGDSAITSVIALPEHWPILPNVNPVLSRHDHYAKFFSNLCFGN